MFPRGDGHVMSSAPGMRAQHEDSDDWVFATRNDPKPIPVTYHRGVLRPGSADAGRRGEYGPHLRLHRLRPAPVQPADRRPAAAAAPERRRRGCLGPVDAAPGGVRVAPASARERGSARACQRDGVRRCRAALPRVAAGGCLGLAGRAARPPRRQGDRLATRTARGALDDRRTRPTGRPVALGAARALCRSWSGSRRCSI